MIKYSFTIEDFLYLYFMKLSPIFFFLLFIPSSILGQVEISLHLDKGRTYSLSTYAKKTIIESSGETESRTVTTEKGEHSYTVLNEYDSLYLMQVEFRHFSLKVESSEKTIFYSSDISDKTDIVSTVLSKIINKPFQVMIRKDFTWKEIWGLDSIFLHSFSDYNLTEEVRQQVNKLILEGMKSYTRQDASLTAVMFGSKKIKPDEVWVHEYTSEHVVPTKDSCTYQFSETTGDLYEVSGAGTVTSLEDEIINEGATVSYQLNGTTNTSVKFFKNSFWIHEAVLRTEMTGFAEVKGVSSPDKSKVPMRIITEATISGF